MSFHSSNIGYSSSEYSHQRNRFDDPEWLRPWRTPEDTLDGGLALLMSVDIMLGNVQKARKTSVQQIYGLRRDPQTANLMTSMRSIEAQQRMASTEITLYDIACSPSSRRTSVILDPRSSPQLSFASPTHNVKSSDEHHNFHSKPHEEGADSLNHVTNDEIVVGRPSATMSDEVNLSRDSSPDVPTIPRFSKLLEEKEKLMKHIELEAQPHTRSRQRNYSEEEEEEENPSQPHSYSPLRYNSVDMVEHTARPARERTASTDGVVKVLQSPDSDLLDIPENLSSHGRQRPSGDGDDNLLMNSSDPDDIQAQEEGYEEFDEENASEQNFGEGGHLACVPGDSLNNRYTLIRQLGVGRSSRVWLALDLEQCSISRRQLIKELGEAEIRKLYNPKEKPLFVAIKLFRCGETYSDCAIYESNVLKYINEYIRIKRIQKRFTINITGTNSRKSGNSSPSSTPQRQTSPGRNTSNTFSAQPSVNNSIISQGDFASSVTSVNVDRQLEAITSFNDRITCMKGYFTVEGDYGTHHCLVLDVVGAGVDAAINEAELKGLPIPIVRSILTSALEGLALLASLNVIHTDIKPENLLFVDLENSIADEMQELQTSHLHTKPNSKLWGPSTERRRSVAEYLRASKSTTGSIKELILSETEYRVYVSDFGLSFVVPPALRAGVEGLRELGGDEVLEMEAVEQVELMTREREAQRRQSNAKLPSPATGKGIHKQESSDISQVGSPPPFQSITAAPSGALDSASNVRVERVSMLNVQKMPSDGANGSPERFSQQNVAYATNQPGSPLPSVLSARDSERSSSVPLRQCSPPNPLRLDDQIPQPPPISAIYSCVVAPPTELEQEILRQQNYRRGIMVQSREYRSPEIILGQYFLPSCDIWSIGCIAYELVTGKFLFDVHREYDDALDDATRALQREEKAEKSASTSRLQKWFGKGAKDGEVEPNEGGEAAEDEDYIDEAERVEALYYEEREKDMDVIHLKSIMRLIGPPPLHHLLHDPMGVSVEHFFDKEGNFLFLENDDNLTCGIEQATPFMNHDLRSIRAQRSHAKGRRHKKGDEMNEEDEEPPTYDSLRSSHSNMSSPPASSLNTRSSSPLFACTSPPNLHSVTDRTMNYPILTSRWKKIREELADKFPTKEEARKFEEFLSRCLQWDPLRRADALSLLQSEWILKM